MTLEIIKNKFYDTCMLDISALQLMESWVLVVLSLPQAWFDDKAKTITLGQN